MIAVDAHLASPTRSCCHYCRQHQVAIWSQAQGVGPVCRVHTTWSGTAGQQHKHACVSVSFSVVLHYTLCSTMLGKNADMLGENLCFIFIFMPFKHCSSGSLRLRHAVCVVDSALNWQSQHSASVHTSQPIQRTLEGQWPGMGSVHRP